MKKKMLGSMIVLGVAGLVLGACGNNKDSANDKDGGKTETKIGRASCRERVSSSV